MGALEGRIAIVTGAGRGLGREHALLFAREGAKVVVNDLGGDADGTGADQTAAQSVVAEIEALGGEAVVNGSSVSDWDAAQALVAETVEILRVDELRIAKDEILEFESVRDCLHAQHQSSPNTCSM